MRVAVKCIARSVISEAAESTVRNEVTTLQSLHHPHIVGFVDFFNDDAHFYLCMEYVSGGELFERIVLRESYDEEIARKSVRNICLAVKYLHNCDIVHRDIKPENILLMDDEDDTNIKIADFGLATR
ncbi:Camk1, partial [Symbiodinium microadriaticum]